MDKLIHIYPPKLSAFVILASMFLTGCSDSQVHEETIRKLGSRIRLLEGQLADRDNDIEHFLLTFESIEGNLAAIRNQESSLREVVENAEYLGNQSERIRRDMALINTLVSQNKNFIRDLKTRLKSDGGSLKGLRKKMERLLQESGVRDSQISLLKEGLIDKKFKIEDLNALIDEKDLQLALQEAELDRQKNIIVQKTRYVQQNVENVFYVTGSMRDLKKKGIVKNEGAVLGMGGDKKFETEGVHKHFRKINRKTSSEFPLNCKKAKIISSHPRNSYALHKGPDGKFARLEILDKDRFWNSSRYLVVATN